MKIEVTQQLDTLAQTREVWARVDEAAPRPTRGRTGMWIPTRLHISWTRTATNGGVWGHWVPSAQVRGHKVRDDGTLYGDYVDLVDFTDGEWTDTIDEHHPEGRQDRERYSGRR